MVFVGHGPSEIGEHAIAEIFGDVASKARDRAGNAILIAARQLVDVFRVRRRSDQVAEEHAEQPPVSRRFGRGLPVGRKGRRFVRTSLRKSVYSCENDLPVSKRDTKLPEVGLHKMRERSQINVILDEGLGVFAETELAWPILNRLHRLSIRSNLLEKILRMFVAPCRDAEPLRTCEVVSLASC
jgi:hypothetical protein